MVKRAINKRHKFTFKNITDATQVTAVLVDPKEQARTFVKGYLNGFVYPDPGATTDNVLGLALVYKKESVAEGTIDLADLSDFYKPESDVLWHDLFWQDASVAGPAYKIKVEIKTKRKLQHNDELILLMHAAAAGCNWDVGLNLASFFAE